MVAGLLFVKIDVTMMLEALWRRKAVLNAAVVVDSKNYPLDDDAHYNGFLTGWLAGWLTMV